MFFEILLHMDDCEKAKRRMDRAEISNCVETTEECGKPASKWTVILYCYWHHSALLAIMDNIFGISLN
jgi:hypothetical protein